MSSTLNRYRALHTKSIQTTQNQIKNYLFIYIKNVYCIIIYKVVIFSQLVTLSTDIAQVKMTLSFCLSVRCVYFYNQTTDHILKFWLRSRVYAS